MAPNPGGGNQSVFGQTVLALSKTQFGWQGPLNYRFTFGNFVTSSTIGNYDEIASFALSGVVVNVGPSPLPGNGRWYLWRPDCPRTSWTSGGPGECAFGCVPGERNGNLP